MSRAPDQSTRSRDNDRGGFAEELQALPRSTTRELRDRWQTLLGSRAPRRAKP